MLSCVIDRPPIISGQRPERDTNSAWTKVNINCNNNRSTAMTDGRFRLFGAMKRAKTLPITKNPGRCSDHLNSIRCQHVIGSTQTAPKLSRTRTGPCQNLPRQKVSPSLDVLTSEKTAWRNTHHHTERVNSSIRVNRYTFDTSPLEENFAGFKSASE